MTDPGPVPDPASDPDRSHAGQPTIGELLAVARKRLSSTPFGAPGREASTLLGFVLGLSEAQIIARDRDPVNPAAADRFEELLERRLAGEPVAYLLGRREFWGRDFKVDSRVLIPRPETEHLVEAALALDVPEDARVIDVGTGSGAIAITFALERPRWRILATDSSLAALSVARTNALEHGLGRPESPSGKLSFFATDLLSGFDLSEVDLVVSNPPYIGREEENELSIEITRFEPHGALFSDDGPIGGGTAILWRLLVDGSRLAPGTRMVVEIGHRQHAALERLAELTRSQPTETSTEHGSRTKVDAGPTDRKIRSEVDPGPTPRPASAIKPWTIEQTIEDYSGIARTVVLRRL